MNREQKHPFGVRRPRKAALLMSGALALGACSPEVGAETPLSSISVESQMSTQAADVGATPEKQEYESHTVVATVYWIGEGATEENGYISNVPSAWSSDAVRDFGGVDSPEGRHFTPSHNTFYFALPASEFTETGPQPGAYEAAPWDSALLGEGESLFKGRWVRIEKDGEAVYAQWQDVGPCANEQPECVADYGYVFGNQQPVNTFGQKAGIDLSPDAARSLGVDGSDRVTWKFVDRGEVPDGPWTKYPAITNKTNW